MHCAKGAQAAFCRTAKAVKFGQTKPTHTAVPDALPDEPGGYSGFQALFGHRYVAPQLGAGTPNLTHHGFQVTNAAGNLVNLNGNQLNGAFLTNHPGFPGFGSINASQTLAYLADMLEKGLPVVDGYMADLHGNEFIPGLKACAHAPDALGSGSSCFIQQAKYYNRAWGMFFKRLAADGITPKNTLFAISSDEGDHKAGANVGRAVQPTPASCNGAKVTGNTVTPDVLCTYPSGTFGELDANINGLLATQKHNTTPFSLEPDTAPEFYVTGQPGPNVPAVRTLERDVGSLKTTNPYALPHRQLLANYLADPAEEAILHMVNADPRRTPTFAMFARPDYFVSTGPTACGGPCVTQNTGFAWDHGDYAAEIDTNYAGFVGPGVAHLGVDGSTASQGPNSAGPNSGRSRCPRRTPRGPGWTDRHPPDDHVPHRAGDDYEHDGRVITQILTHPNSALSPRRVTVLGACYKQLNSSVGEFGTDTLQTATKAIKSKSRGDRRLPQQRTRLCAGSTSSGTGSPSGSRANSRRPRSRARRSPGGWPGADARLPCGHRRRRTAEPARFLIRGR